MSSSSRSPARDSIEVDRVDGYLLFLFALLSTATLFDGFDAAMLTVAAPDTRRTLGISLAEWGVVFAITRLGMVASFFFLFFADRWGRRTLMMLTISGFAVFNALTAFSVSKIDFTVYQFCARVFLTAEYSLAIIVIGEEFPARLRGRAIALLTSFATVGVMVIALLHPYILLGECAAGSVAAGNCIVPEGNWLHDSGQRVVAVVQRFFGLAVDGAHWRVLYILGMVPLGLVFFLRFGMCETRRFVAEQEAAGGQARGVRHTLRVAYAHAKTPWQPEYRRQTLLVALLWNCVHLVTAPAVAFWVIYAREELGFSPAVVGLIIFWGYVGGIAGHCVAGYLIDRIGRKATCAGSTWGQQLRFSCCSKDGPRERSTFG